jgi:hypothetical protein
VHKIRTPFIRILKILDVINETRNTYNTYYVNFTNSLYKNDTSYYKNYIEITPTFTTKICQFLLFIKKLFGLLSLNITKLAETCVITLLTLMLFGK